MGLRDMVKGWLSSKGEDKPPPSSRSRESVSSSPLAIAPPPTNHPSHTHRLPTFSDITDVNMSDVESPWVDLTVPTINNPSSVPSQRTDSFVVPTITFLSHPDSHDQGYSRSRSLSSYVDVMHENEQLALSPLGTQCALSIAQVTAELAPIPCIGLLVEPLTCVFQAVERARVNKEQWKLLQGRCVMVMRIAGAQVTNYGQQHYPGLQQASQALQETLKRVTERARYYNELNEIVALLQFQKISEEIRVLFGELDSCLVLFSYATDVAQSEWLGEFQAVQGQETVELKRVHGLLEPMNSDLGTIDQIQERSVVAVEVLRQELVNKVYVLQNQATVTPQDFASAQQIVRTILAITKLQFPPGFLLGKQCEPDSTAPIKTGITCDIHRASFLGGEKVAKKVFRIGMSDQEFVSRYAERFTRIANVWGEFRSDHTLPFYGVGMESFEGDKHFQLYMVSPLMKNFDAITYLKQYRNNAGMKQGILRIITDAALGLQYLHNRNPPVVHSNMQGENILITDSGGGVLGGFGLTKALESEDKNLIPPAVMTNKAQLQRWTAPELFAEESPRPQTQSDVWGWAMTALEIVSGFIPYHSHKQALTVMLKVCNGPPRRKDHMKFEDYAHRPNEMWELFEMCWNNDPNERPTMDYVVTRLKKIAKMPEGTSNVDPPGSTPVTRSETLRSVEMSTPDMFEHLVRHGCLDLTGSIDLSATSDSAVAHGGNSDVWKGRLDNGTEIAIKVWRHRGVFEENPKTLKRATRELYNWSKADHENVHKLLGVVLFQGRLGMISEWMEHGNLQDYLRQHQDVDRYLLCIQAAKAVKYFHNNSMVHGDLKALNFLVSSGGIVKLTDFDHSIISESSLAFSETTSNGGGTLRWMAPELVLETPYPNEKSQQTDIYALGMTFLEIITSTVPYSTRCRSDRLMYSTLSRKILPERTIQFEGERGDQMWSLLVRCWEHDPAARPTADAVLDALQSLA